MFTIRHEVFETNSSSEHALKVNRTIRRTKDEFPQLNEDGVLEIEATRYWQSGERTSSVRDIMEYICLLCYAVDHNYDSAFTHIKRAYEEMGLPVPSGLEVYVIDHYGKRLSYADDDFINGPHLEYKNNSQAVLPNGDVKPDTRYRWYLTPIRNNEIGEEEQYDQDFAFTNIDAFVGEHATMIIAPFRKMLCECSYLEQYIGVASNCLTCSATLDACLDELVEDEETYKPEYIDDAFRYQSMLYFYHT